MSLFQCEVCGCCENTACAAQGFHMCADSFDWSYAPERKDKKCCSACGPTRYSKGQPTTYGKWHGKFNRIFLPLGMFKTNREGNLEHIETGETDFRKYQIVGQP